MTAAKTGRWHHPAWTRVAPGHRSGAARAALRILSATAFLSGAALVAFHAWLFWDQLAAGRLLEPDVALRWTAALGICGLLAWLRRLGIPLTHGRRALSLWLLVILLHLWSAGGPPVELEAFGPAHGAADASALFVVPVVAGALALSFAFLLTSMRAPRPVGPAVGPWLYSRQGSLAVRRFDPGPCRAPRPPPSVSA